MKLIRNLFKKNKKDNSEKDNINNKKLSEDEILYLEKKYKNHPHFISICRYDNCNKPIYKNDKYKTVKNNNKNMKVHVLCYRKMRKEAKKIIKTTGLVK